MYINTCIDIYIFIYIYVTPPNLYNWHHIYITPPNMYIYYSPPTGITPENKPCHTDASEKDHLSEEGLLSEEEDASEKGWSCRLQTGGIDASERLTGE